MELRSTETIELLPHSGGTVRAMSRIGYDFGAAAADVIDNSIDANASLVEIRIFRSDREITTVSISDNGDGMNRSELLRGMQFGGKIEHEVGDLGAFGMGLKTASFSQCKTLTVISKKSPSDFIACRWRYENIGNGWACEIFEDAGVQKIFEKFSHRNKSALSGTVVLWERLDRLGVGPADGALDEFLNTFLPRLEVYLGMVFHRFISSGALEICISVKHERRSMAIPRAVRPLDPFGYRQSGDPLWPRSLLAKIPPAGNIRLMAHIWPYGSQDPNFLMGGKTGVEWQGFFFYRNNRLIQAGGWNDVLKSTSDPTLSLARVSVDMPPVGVDVNVQKTSLQISAAQAHSLIAATDGEETLETYLEQARQVYKSGRSVKRVNSNRIVPGKGLPMAVRKYSAQVLNGGRLGEEVDFVWLSMPRRKVFDIDIMGKRLVLNDRYRRVILRDARASAADAPIFKLLLFLLLQSDFAMQRSSSKQEARLRAYNDMLLSVMEHLDK